MCLVFYHEISVLHQNIPRPDIHASGQQYACVVRDDGERQWMVADHDGKDVVRPYQFRVSREGETSGSHTHTSLELSSAEVTRRTLHPSFSYLRNALWITIVWENSKFLLIEDSMILAVSINQFAFVNKNNTSNVLFRYDERMQWEWITCRESCRINVFLMITQYNFQKNFAMYI